jgi:crotonobetainyl-CoA:carnitine CoA-transferase CaiB-like acyl-CoA transferase
LHTPAPFKEWKNPFYHIYKCKDERLFFLLGGSYSKLPLTLAALGLNDLVDDPRYQNHTTMRENSSELYDRMIEAFATKTAQEWVEILELLDIAFEVLAQNQEVHKDPQVWANGCLGYMECPDGSTYVVPTTPVDFSGVERAQSQHVGTVGCHTSEILSAHGYTQEQIRELMDKGIIVGK